MAKRKRDYKKEEAARKALAVSRGFKSRGAQRYAIEHGKAPAIKPWLIKKPSTYRAQVDSHLLPILPRIREPESAKKPAPPTIARSGRLSPKETAEFMGRTADQIAEDWSELHGRSFIGEYHPERAGELGLTHAQYRNAYLRAFVIDQHYSKVRHHGGSPELRYWFVDVNHYYSADEYETRYGTQHGRTDAEWTEPR